MKNSARHRRAEPRMNRSSYMWGNLLVMLWGIRMIYRLVRRHGSADSSDGASGLLNLTVARVFQVVYGGSIYQSLRIPDTGGHGYQTLDALLLTDRELYVFSVQNLSGTVKIRNDGTWLEIGSNGKVIVHPNMVLQLREKVSVLADYISRRGVTISPEAIKPLVVFSNPTASPEQEILLQPEVLSYDRYEDIQTNISAANILGIRSTVPATSKIAQHQQLQYILSTAPTWDRLELRGGGSLFGEFLHFKGKASDLHALGVPKRSKVKKYEVLHPWDILSLFGIHTVREVSVVYTLRDYRQGGAAQPGEVKIGVRGDLEIVFQVNGSSKPRSYELKDINGLYLRA